MERDAHYGAVGAFVLVVLAMATVFVLWYTNAQERREYRRYEVYFSGSVSGLSEGSTVRYLGVNVGRVARIRLDGRDPKRVLVLIDIDASTPVTPQTLARLSTQGLTGVLFIDLGQGTAETRGLNPTVESQRYPVIRSVPSDLDLFLGGLPDLAAQATYVTSRLNRALSDENLIALTDSINNIRAATATMPATAKNVDALVAQLRRVVTDAQVTATSLRATTSGAGPDVIAASARLRTVAENLDSTSARLDALLARHEQDVDRFASHLGDFSALMHDSRDTADQIGALARTLHEDPSRLLYQPVYRSMEIPP